MIDKGSKKKLKKNLLSQLPQIKMKLHVFPFPSNLKKEIM